MFQPGHLLGHNGLGQTELRDAVHQHAANLVQRLEHGDVIPLPGQIAGTGQARRAGAYHSYLVAVALRHGGSAALMAVGIVIVRHKPLQTADAHGLTLDAPDALALALVLLGADTAADGGQAVGGGDDAEGLVELAFRHLGDELGNMYVHGAAVHALGVLAVQAALGLVDSHFLSIAQGHLVEVLVADIGFLRGHGILLQRHIGHDYSASFLNRLQVSSYLWASKSLYIWFRLTARSQSTL